MDVSRVTRILHTDTTCLGLGNDSRLCDAQHCMCSVTSWCVVVCLQVCPPGKYAASSFSTTCLFCPPGTFSYYWGAPTCRTCLPGTFAATAGSLFCNICK